MTKYDHKRLADLNYPDLTYRDALRAARHDGDVDPLDVPRLRIPPDAHEIRGAGWTEREQPLSPQFTAWQMAGSWTLVGLGFLASWTLLLLGLWALWSGAWRVVTRWI